MIHCGENAEKFGENTGSDKGNNQCGLANQVTSTSIKSLDDEIEMNTADWRWAAHKGFWDPHCRSWNEEMGGMKAYILQRNQRRDIRQTKRASRKSQEISQGAIYCQGPSYFTQQVKQVSTDSGSDPLPTLPQQPSKRSKHCQSDEFDAEIRVERPFTCTELCTAEQRPTPWRPQNRLGDSNILLSFMMRHRWSHLAIRHYWTVGYQAEPIIAIFQSLPRRLRSAIAEALDAVQRCSDIVCSEPSDAEEPAGKAACAWDDDDVHGFVGVEFDPTSQARVRVAANARAAALLGMHREELLVRFARRDVPLALPPLDALRAFLDGLRRGACADEATRYYRIVPPPLANGRSAPAPALVCAVSVRVLAPCRRVQEVGCHTRGTAHKLTSP
jgi:hypothetical protein